MLSDNSIRVWVATMVLGVIAGCCGVGMPIRDVPRTLEVGNVIGRWVLTPDSLQVARRHGLTPQTGPYTVTFRPDGTLAFNSIVDDMGLPKSLTAAGRWVLLHGTTGDSNIVYHNLIRLDLTDQVFHFQFDERDGRLILCQSVGDPDQWEFFEYERDR